MRVALDDHHTLALAAVLRGDLAEAQRQLDLWWLVHRPNELLKARRLVAPLPGHEGKPLVLPHPGASVGDTMTQTHPEQCSPGGYRGYRAIWR